MKIFFYSTKFFIFLLFFLSLTCKSKKKLNEFYDPKWRDESTKISLEICNKLSFCLKANQKTPKNSIVELYLEKNLQGSKCIEKHKKSNVYLLKGAEPEIIKNNFLNCYRKFISLSCEDVYPGGLTKISECNWIIELQKL